jgi:hypothetical protein
MLLHHASGIKPLRERLDGHWAGGRAAELAYRRTAELPYCRIVAPPQAGQNGS